ncbi:MAG TPA: ABC transporter ATP-binding protein [Amaricoccus sp.]|uniref:ABC transporter ATP-binding protein n=1 Tax=Amaricoccus sp. TaxID=1872485 RepID=UPI002BB29760|nr:ABC transporter ATP-binding protein [Amaricoccus sp.]HMQ94728.1 ABC transporter ATP-binding protein [Amaricoccus sp.]HMR53482.1 ABC transporter ATP-binding protein [Amaricoccus sp.]HMR60591.1 ABC transporter ATP-binding protein [Amaricoccus sp.]HMU00460.1 ABC transporter ATP-binding protein [Amaricoccus sp.]
MSIDISNLTVTYGAEDVISGLSLAIPEGSFFTLLGPSGCGKTTLLRTIAGFVKASGGSIRFSGRDVTKLPPHRRDIGMVFQDYALFPDKTVFQNVAYGLHARGERGESVARKVGEALERVGLGHLGSRHPAALSGGQRQRVALARAMVIKPQVLLMDEPLSNLDAKLRIQIRETITELQREANITTVFVTHDQEEALSMSNLIGVMNRGAVEQLGTPQEIYARPRTGYVADFVGAANRLPVRLRPAKAPLVEASLGDVAILATDAMAAPAPEGLLILRPEDLKISAAPQEALQSMPATVRGRQYLGSKTSYRLDLGEALQVVAELHGPGHDGFAPGDRVSLGIDSALARVIAA